MSFKRITISSTINASPAKVWEYYSNPEHITKWNHASDDWHCPKASNDLRTGGKFSSTMAARDGSMSFDFEGVYDEVTDGKKIAYTMLDGRKAEVSFEDLGDSTRVVTSFDAETMHSADMQQAGWQAILDNFRKYVESAKDE